MAENIPDKPKHLGSFTNDPNLKGQIDPDTGKEWIYTPDQSYWRDYKKDPVTHPEITMEGGEGGRTTIETPTFGYSGSAEALPEARAMIERQDKLIASGKRRRARPPEGARGPNYTDRSGFEQHVFKQLGGINPFTVDVMAEVNKTYAQSFPDIYNKFFRGKVTWADRGKMTKDQIEEANVLRNRYRAYLHDRITSTLKAKQNDYTMMMQRFDHEAAVVKANKERLVKEQAAMRKAPTGHAMVSKETGKLTWHEYKNGQWVDTGMKIKAPEKPKEGKPEYKPGQALKQINTILKARADLGKGNMITDALFTMIAKEDPEAAKDILPFLNKELSDTEKSDLEEIWQKRIEYLMPLIPESSRPKISFMAKKPTAKEKKIKGKVVVERRTYKGKTLVKYSDGSIEYEK